MQSVRSRIKQWLGHKVRLFSFLKWTPSGTLSSQSFSVCNFKAGKSKQRRLSRFPGTIILEMSNITICTMKLYKISTLTFLCVRWLLAKMQINENDCFYSDIRNLFLHQFEVSWFVRCWIYWIRQKNCRPHLFILCFTPVIQSRNTLNL